jgi:endonuclease YncB( thermonuclease family)
MDLPLRIRINPIANLPRCLIVAVCFLPGLSFADNLDCPCKVVKVTDGDTVHMLDRTKERHKIRLGGIDAPESSQDYGRQSRLNLSKLIAGKAVTVEYSKRDRYGRIIGKIIKDDQDINLQQIKDGYAWHYKYYQNEQSESDRNAYDQAEREARAVKKGLWKAKAIPPWEYRRMKNKK